MTNLISIRSGKDTLANPTSGLDGSVFCRLPVALTGMAFSLMPIIASAVEFDGTEPWPTGGDVVLTQSVIGALHGTCFPPPAAKLEILTRTVEKGTVKVFRGFKLGADPADSVKRFAPWAEKLFERN